MENKIILFYIKWYFLECYTEEFGLTSTTAPLRKHIENPSEHMCLRVFIHMYYEWNLPSLAKFVKEFDVIWCILKYHKSSFKLEELDDLKRADFTAKNKLTLGFFQT